MDISVEDLELLKNFVPCRFDYQCVGDRALNVKDVLAVNRDNYVDCHTPGNSSTCGYLIPSPFSAFCSCPVNVLLTKKLHI